MAKRLKNPAIPTSCSRRSSSSPRPSGTRCANEWIRRALTFPISQSGETADTLAALREARDQGSRAIAICNVVGSSLARDADGVVYTRAGIEIGVASTKAFTAQLVAVTLLALKLGLARNLVDPALVRQVIKALLELPDLLSVVLGQSDAIRGVAERL